MGELPASTSLSCLRWAGHQWPSNLLLDCQVVFNLSSLPSQFSLLPSQARSRRFQETPKPVHRCLQSWSWHLPCCWAGWMIESLQMGFWELDEWFLVQTTKAVLALSCQIEENAFWKQTKKLKTFPSAHLNFSQSVQGQNSACCSICSLNLWRISEEINSLSGETMSLHTVKGQRPGTEPWSWNLIPPYLSYIWELEKGRIAYQSFYTPEVQAWLLSAVQENDSLHHQTNQEYILLLLCDKQGWEAPEIRSTCESCSDTNANCLVL